MILNRAFMPILLLVELACPAVYSAMQDTPDSVTITEKDNGHKTKVALGCILVLKLGANPGTGYAWHIVRNEPALLQSSGESIFEPIIDETKKGSIGAPAFQVFRFKAQKKGTEALELHYMRKWEKTSPLKKFSITVEIQ